MLSSNMISTNQNNFPLNLLLTERQVSSLYKGFTNTLSFNVKS